MEISTKARAKLNLSLKVVGQREDGYHLLDSIVAEIGLCDEIFVATRQDGKVSVNTSVGVIENNTALRMANLLTAKYSLGGADIYIDKKIPFSAGLGGSSADAAGVYNAFRTLYGLPIEDNAVLASIGADVPFMAMGGAARLEGIGDRLTKIELPPYEVAVLLGKEKMSTADVYRSFDTKGGYASGDVADIIERLKKGDESDYLINDLESGATSIDLSTPKELLRKAGFGLVAMTGSGNAVVGYTLTDFDKKAEALKPLAKQYGLRLITDRLKD